MPSLVRSSAFWASEKSRIDTNQVAITGSEDELWDLGLQLLIPLGRMVGLVVAVDGAIGEVRPMGRIGATTITRGGNPRDRSSGADNGRDSLRDGRGITTRSGGTEPHGRRAVASISNIAFAIIRGPLHGE